VTARGNLKDISSQSPSDRQARIEKLGKTLKDLEEWKNKFLKDVILDDYIHSPIHKDNKSPERIASKINGVYRTNISPTKPQVHSIII
jgi:hypothetical protein